MKGLRKFNFKGFTLVELMVVVAILGILAVIAVPAFIKYMRRAKTTEAIDELDKIYKGSAYYYTAPHISANGSKLYCQFPTDQGVTPATTCCGSLGSSEDGDADERCDSNSDRWNTRTWSALTFQMSDQHYFVYAFDWLDGTTLDTAQATASAYADLDCDNTQSTFQRLAFGDPHATYSECSQVGSSAFYVENETE
ncbi:MAG: prepilin-type N-terminal cleavage/methylation domain-containing protein [Deltaproteobacteria bacterium]|nr:prepilin-type N-terminal cleavage/methylation domain-containing protein [Deltaproteobacteria bacterium]